MLFSVNISVLFSRSQIVKGQDSWVLFPGMSQPKSKNNT